jgi:hypothetical protein
MTKLKLKISILLFFEEKNTNALELRKKILDNGNYVCRNVDLLINGFI